MDLITGLISAPIIFYFLTAYLGWTEEWGKEPSGEPRGPHQTLGYPPMKWKNWKKWTGLEILFSPVMLCAYSGMVMFYIVAVILFGIDYVVFSNPICKFIWKKLLTRLSKPLMS